MSASSRSVRCAVRAEDIDVPSSTRGSPDYLKYHEAPETPQDLLRHRLLAFSYGRPEASWTFVHVNNRDHETLTFQPHLSINDFAGLTPALVADRRSSSGGSTRTYS
jgi:hypothetical protein